MLVPGNGLNVVGDAGSLDTTEDARDVPRLREPSRIRCATADDAPEAVLASVGAIDPARSPSVDSLSLPEPSRARPFPLRFRSFSFLVTDADRISAV